MVEAVALDESAVARPVNSELLLVGSLPAESAESALRQAAGYFDGLVFTLPDGETGARSEDRSFFRPLVDLEPGDARIFLGLVLPIDGEAGLRRRVATASRHISDVGVAMYCGFGRQPGQDGAETMREHGDVVRAVRRP